MKNTQLIIVICICACNLPLEIVPGAEGGKCRDDKTCDAGLTCIENICVKSIFEDAGNIGDGGNDSVMGDFAQDDLSQVDAEELDSIVDTIHDMGWCGDDLKNGSEQCDNKDFGKETCLSQGFSGGQLNCTSTCTIETSNCYLLLDSTGFGIYSGTGSQTAPALAFGQINFLVTWLDVAIPSLDLYGVRVDSSAVVLDSSPIAISKGMGKSAGLAIAHDGQNYLVVWMTNLGRSGGSDIFGKRISNSGEVLDQSPIPINNVDGEQWSPSVASDGTNFLVVWSDGRNGNSAMEIYGTRVTSTGSVLDEKGFSISTASLGKFDPAVAYNGNNFLVVWGDLQNGINNGYDIYGARVDKIASVLDVKGIAISTALESQNFPDLSCDRGGSNCLVVWADSRNRAMSSDDIYGVRVSSLGELLDKSELKISTIPGSQTSPKVIFDGSNYFVAWMDSRTLGAIHIYGTPVSRDGIVLDSAGIAISTGTSQHGSVSLANDGKNTLVVWDDGRNSSTTDRDIFGARLTY